MKSIIKIMSVFLMSLMMTSIAHGAKDEQPLDNRIEKWVNKTCGDDNACAERKRAHYKKRMEKYNQSVQKKCGDDQACRQEMRAKYMQRRAKREERIAAHCGEDEACRDKLRELYSQRMEQGRGQCEDDKACWEAFYKEHRPKK